MTSALIIFGGWEKHDPEGVAQLLHDQLQANGISVTLSNSFDSLKEFDLTLFDLILPVWTLDTIDPSYVEPLLAAVRNGVGLAGTHGIIDSFRHEAEFHLMLGGQWVSHFEFAITNHDIYMDGAPSPITAGLPTINVTSEQYYVLVDPANTTLATMRVPGDITMPVAWTKQYGSGRVFYCSLGHSVDILAQPDTLTLVTRGILWAARHGEFA
jgi:type 1 glutamine amidotransferase